MNLDCTCFDSKFQDVAGGGGLLAPAVLQGPPLEVSTCFTGNMECASHRIARQAAAGAAAGAAVADPLKESGSEYI